MTLFNHDVIQSNIRLRYRKEAKKSCTIVCKQLNFDCYFISNISCYREVWTLKTISDLERLLIYPFKLNFLKPTLFSFVYDDYASVRMVASQLSRHTITAEAPSTNPLMITPFKLCNRSSLTWRVWFYFCDPPPPPPPPTWLTGTARLFSMVQLTPRKFLLPASLWSLDSHLPGPIYRQPFGLVEAFGGFQHPPGLGGSTWSPSPAGRCCDRGTTTGRKGTGWIYWAWLFDGDSRTGFVLRYTFGIKKERGKNN